jgi:hypothetical protein
VIGKLKTASGRRYLARFALAMAAYVVTILLAAYCIRHDLVGGPLKWILAMLPGLAIAGAIAAVGMRIIELEDEYLRMLMVRQVLIGTGITLSLSTMWGFLEMFDLVGHIELSWVFVLWAFSLGVGAVANRITHGTWGSCL